ncbi:MAG TPA: ABC transporter ATP-binding protein [Candidatus Acidoferrum sp.]|nr:ABC transporter ATP-binding protein [Candidatus Acidoferrum sp.]
MLLEVDNITLYYEQIAALKGVSLNLEAGEIVAIIGANGAGKTTLINTISGILRPRSGQIRFKGETISGLPAHKVARKRIVQIPEGRKLFNKLSVRENLEMGAYSIEDKAKVRADVAAMEALFPVLGERRNQPAGTLSGGEQQMLAVARGLMAGPELLMFDEPSMGLSPVLVERVFTAIREINQRGISILLVEQNARKSLQIATRAYVLETGTITLSDRADRLLENEQVKRAYLGA